MDATKEPDARLRVASLSLSDDIPVGQVVKTRQLEDGSWEYTIVPPEAPSFGMTAAPELTPEQIAAIEPIERFVRAKVKERMRRMFGE